MAHRKALYETEVVGLQAAVELRKKLLESRKLDAKAIQRDPVYRSLKAKVSQFKKRIAAIELVGKVSADTAQRKAERLAQPKQPKEKKKAAPPPPAKAKAKASKGEGKGG